MGKALGFYASQRIAMRRVKLDKDDPIDESIGLKIVCKVIKNRFANGNPFKRCEYYAIYNKGIDNSLEIINILERNGIINKKGSWYSLTNTKNEIIKIDNKECRWQGRKQLLHDFENSEDLKKYILNLMDNFIKSDNIGISLSQEEINRIKEKEENLNNTIKEIEENEV